MREQLKKIGFRLTELAEYLQISRPTLYKYIECYETGDYSEIRPDILLFFSYLKSNPSADKRCALQYLIEHIGNKEESVDMTCLTEALERFGSSPDKIDFLLSVMSDNWMDDLIPHLNRCRSVLGRPDAAEAAEEYRSALDDFKNILTRIGEEANGNKQQ